MTTDRFRAVAVGLIALLGAVCAGGCHFGSWSKVAIDGPAVTAESHPAVDITNFNGSVIVVADPKLKQGWVKARVKRTNRKSPGRKDLREAVTITAQSEQQEGGLVLRVTAASTLDIPTDAKVDLIVRMPVVAGVSVKNAGGSVAIRGVAGAVQVENGYGGGKGGRIEVRTGSTMTYPVSLTTTEGLVHYQVPPDSTARFDLSAGDGAAEIIAKGGVMTAGVPSVGKWTGVLNKGDNPVILRSDKGRVRVYVIDDAGTYRPDRWTLRNENGFKYVY